MIGRREQRILLAAGALVAGILAGTVTARLVRGVRRNEADEREVELTFEDGTVFVADPDSPEGRELSSLANRVLEIGV